MLHRALEAQVPAFSHSLLLSPSFGGPLNPNTMIYNNAEKVLLTLTFIRTSKKWECMTEYSGGRKIWFATISFGTVIRNKLQIEYNILFTSTSVLVRNSFSCCIGETKNDTGLKRTEVYFSHTYNAGPAPCTPAPHGCSMITCSF